MKPWSIKQIFLGSLFVKILLVVLSTLMFLVIPLSPAIQNDKPNANLYAFYVYDGANYLNICNNGYYNDLGNNDAEKLRYFPFLPGLPAINCAGKLFKSVLDMKYYGPVIFNLLFFIVLCYSLKYYLDASYTDEGLKKYIFISYLLFPFSFFLHLNYTEPVYMSLAFLSLYFLKKGNVGKSQMLGLFMGFVRITAIPFAFLAWIQYTIQTLAKQANTKWYKPQLSRINFKKYVIDSLLFLGFAVGAIIDFLYYKLRFGNFWLYFDSQKAFYGRESGLKFLATIPKLLLRHDYNYYLSDDYNRYIANNIIHGSIFEFYTSDFRYHWLLYFPFAIALIGTILLVIKRRWYDLTFSWVMWIIPMLSSVDSLDRYLLQSFPFIFIISEFAYKIKVTRYLLLLFYVIMFGIFYALHSHGLWIG